MSDPAPLQTTAETAAQAQTSEPADRVFLSDYVAEIEIGVYPQEHGVTQRLRFDIVLEVRRNTAHIDDSVSRVINYDILVNSIAQLAEGPRVNLLETFAERLAQRLLVDPRARRATIRIEKLDRLPGGARLGCEITRTRAPDAADRVWPLGGEIGG